MFHLKQLVPYALINLLLLWVLVTVGQETTPEAAVDFATLPEQIVLRHEGLFPEGIAYDSLNSRFLVSSIAEGTVYAVDFEGNLSPFIEDERIASSTGLEIDFENDRLLVAVTNLENEAFLGIYDLSTGENLHFVDLKALISDPEGFANDLTIDADGNAYVTDSAAGLIYKVDMAGNASIFLEDEAFSTQFALNGIEYHEEGNYIIAVLVPGLIKIPLDNPANFSLIELEQAIPGEDGIALIDERSLALVSNAEGRVYHIESDDDFATAEITGYFETGDVFPTTVTILGDRLYVLYAYLDHQTTVEEFYIQAVEFSDEETSESTEQP